ncbi:MAG: cob(I)yrinic acid a,c-diamide adenosyltransferase [Lachnospiraceae bacterium]|nr:cob(I)yrinic acid a,c-diamide adenosyltransferase [Lachnospiraceae bacterium]
MACIHIYCGNGKGKTSAALGLAVRAAGRGKRVLIVRFLKTEDSGEVSILRRIPGITVTPCDHEFGFTFQMGVEEKAEAAKYYRQRFEEACHEAVSCGYDILILDEILAACSSSMVREEDVINFLKNPPAHLEIVLTGRNPSRQLLEMADYVSEIRMEKHPYQKGLPARKGIEY